MGSVHPEQRAAATGTGEPVSGPGVSAALLTGPEPEAALSAADAAGLFAHASVDDDEFFGAAFDADGGVEGSSSAPLPGNEQLASRLDNEALAATFGEVAATYLRPLQHFCTELGRGAVASSRLAALLPPLGTVIESARGMGLAHLAERFSSLQGYFEAIQQSGAPIVDGTSRDAVLRVSGSLAHLLPGGFGSGAEGDPLDGVMLRALLQQLPAVTAHSLEQFFAAGFTSTKMLAGADPEELTAITGLAPHLCEVCVHHAGDYLAEREQRLHLTTSAEWLPVLEPRVGELERLQRTIEQGRGGSDEERRGLWRQRQRAVLQVELLLAEMGRVALLEELQRLRLERRLERLREFVVELRRPSREELVQRLAMGQSLQHLDLRDQHLEGIHLPGADLAGSDLTGANLAGADLQGTRFIHASLRESFLRGADLGDAQLRHAHLEGADLSHARLAGADLSRAYLEAARLEGADLERACLRRVRATDANLAGARLLGADLRRADLSGVDAGGADLRGADLGDANVAGTNFRGADLRGAQFDGCDLSTAWIEGARLDGDGGWGDAPPAPAATGPARSLEPAAAQESAAAALEAVAKVVGELGDGLRDPPAAETAASVSCAGSTEHRELPPPNLVEEAETSPLVGREGAESVPPEINGTGLDQPVVVDPVAGEEPAVPVSASQLESDVLIVRRPAVGVLLPLGRWVWAAAAAALVLVLSAVLLQQGATTPGVGDSAEMMVTVPAERAVVAPRPEWPVSAAATAPASAPTQVVEPSRPIPSASVSVKAEPVKTTVTAPTNSVSTPVAKLTEAVPVKQAEPAVMAKVSRASVRAPQAAPVKRAKPATAKQVKAAPVEKVGTSPAQPARVAPVETAKVGPGKMTGTAPAEVVRKTAPAVAKTAPKTASQPVAIPVVSAAAPTAAQEALSVAFVDANLEACVRAALGRPQGRLSAVAVAGLTELNCATPEPGQADVARLEGIETLVGLVSLDLSFNQVTDIRPLAGLERLEQLNLRSNRIADIGPVAALPGACKIDLWQNPIDDITPLLVRGKR